MTIAADVNLQFRTGAASLKRISATAGDRGFLVFGVDAVFHGRLRYAQQWFRGIESQMLRDTRTIVQGLLIREIREFAILQRFADEI